MEVVVSQWSSYSSWCYSLLLGMFLEVGLFFVILEFIVCINIIYIQVAYLSICLWCCGVDVTGQILRLIDSTLYVLYNNTFWWLLCWTLLSAVSLGTPGIIVQIRPYNHKKLTVTVSNQVRSMCDLVVEAGTRLSKFRLFLSVKFRFFLLLRDVGLKVD